MAGLATTIFVFPAVGPARRARLIKSWSARLLHVLSVRCHVRGEPALADGNVLVVANHISWLDIFVLNGLHAVRFVAKSELADWPVAGRLIRDTGTLFIERTSRRDTHRVNGVIAAALAQGDVVAVFPEGTTTSGEHVLPFRSSLLQPIVDADGAVQPLALRYRNATGARSTAPAYTGDDTFARSFWRICAARGLEVEVIVLPRIPAGGRHRRAVAQDAEEAIRRALQ